MLRSTALSALAVAVVLLTGCGSTDEGAQSDPTAISTEDAKSTSIDDITVEGEPTAKPTVTFEAPLVVAETVSKVISEGTGPEVADGQQVTAHMSMFSGTTGEAIESSYDLGTPSGFPLDTSQINQGLYDALLGVPVGSRVLMTLNGSAAQGSPTETLVYVVDVTDAKDVPKPLERAEGRPQDPVPGMPTVTLEESGKPTISQPEGTAPTDLQVHPTIKGEGATIAEGDTVSVHYSGWLWDDASEPFDNSWDRGEPFSVTPVGSAPVIDGWNQALVGQTVGSQLLVVIPPSLGYGEAGSPPNIPGNATLVFVIDILSAVN